LCYPRKMNVIQKIKTLFSELPGDAQKLLLEELLYTQELEGKVLKSAGDEVQARGKKKPCPHCQSEDVYKRGSQSGVRMYSCKKCKKWYSETTGTPLYDIKHKNKWQAYLRCMEKGMSIKKIAKELGISIQTSFDWRHKILSSLDQFVPEKMSSEIECDEMELALSNKGSRHLDRKPRKRGSDFKRNQGKEEVTVVQVVTAVERNGKKYLKAVASKRLTKEAITKVFDNKLEDNATLITDKHASYKAFAKENPSIKHKSFIARNHVDPCDKSAHLQNVNNTHSQLRKFLTPFNGVSSKYLQNYLNWFAYSGTLKTSKETIKQWLISILMADQAYHLFGLFKENVVIIRT
jgi:transposase-like protein